MKHNQPPIGLVVSQTAKVIVRNFEFSLAAAGGSLSTWLILHSLILKGEIMQSDLAQHIGVQGPTLTHHLNAMEVSKLVLRKRTMNDRRNHIVQITDNGRVQYESLKQTAQSFDKKLNESMSEPEMTMLRELLAKAANAAQS